MNYYKLTTPRLIMFIIFIVSGVFFFYEKGVDKLNLYDFVLGILIFGILTFLILNKLLSFIKRKEE